MGTEEEDDRTVEDSKEQNHSLYEIVGFWTAAREQTNKQNYDVEELYRPTDGPIKI